MQRLIVFLAVMCLGWTATGEISDSPIPIDSFNDGIKHYRDGTGRTDYPRYTLEQTNEIAANILLYQRSNGGWPANWDPLRILSPEEARQVASDRNKKDTTFDNRATCPQVEYLAHAFKQTGDTQYRDAALRGLDFILEAQYESGGWPHSYPSQDNYRPHITFMDDVMTGVLSTLQKAADAIEPFDFLSSAQCGRAAEAVAKGNACILKLQIKVNGVATVWAGQYDRHTLEPTQARAYELPALVSAESVNVVRYLMTIDPPSPEVIQAVQNAAAWYERSKIHGIRIETIEIDPIRYEHHTATTDRVVVEDPNAPPIWARFYEIGANRPFMANRDGLKVYSLAEVHHERRTGYGWYTYSPASLIERDYPAWRRRLSLD